MEELKASHEAELNAIKDRLRKQKTSSDASTSDQLSRLEAELEEQWKTKSERMAQQTEDKWKRKYRDLEVRRILCTLIFAVWIIFVFENDQNAKINCFHSYSCENETII